VLDAINLEKQGIPAVAVVTEPFARKHIQSTR